MHFTTLVIGEDFEEKMAPYQENNMWDCPSQYLEFDTEISKEEYEKMSDEEKKETRENYDEKDWNYWYFYNPNSFWDWYEIGWRWAGFFKLKEDVPKDKYNNPNFSWGWDEESRQEILKTWNVDQAEVQDIDFEWMKKDEYNKYYNHFSQILERYWEIPKKQNWNFTKEDIEKWQEIRKKEIRNKNNSIWYLWNLEDYQFNTAEEYANFHSKNFINVYYILDENWDLSINDSEDIDVYNEYIKNLPNWTILTLLDCHS